MDIKKVGKAAGITTLVAIVAGITGNCIYNSQKDKEPIQPKEQPLTVSEQSELENKLEPITDIKKRKKIIEWGKENPEDIRILNRGTTAEKNEKAGNYNEAIRILYNICDHLSGKGYHFATIGIADKAINIIKDHSITMDKKWSNYRDDFHLKRARAYARTDRSIERGTEMFDSYFQVIWLNKDNKDPGILEGALKDILHAPSGPHKDVRKKYISALNRYSNEARKIIQNEVKNHLEIMSQTTDYKKMAEKALKTYGFK